MGVHDYGKATTRVGNEQTHAYLFSLNEGSHNCVSTQNNSCGYLDWMLFICKVDNFSLTNDILMSCYCSCLNK